MAGIVPGTESTEVDYGSMGANLVVDIRRETVLCMLRERGRERVLIYVYLE